MFRLSQVRRVRLVLLASAAVAAGALAAEGAGPIRRLSLDRQAPVIELFEGIDQGTLQARVLPRNEFSASVQITNTSQTVQTVDVPKAVVSVHVLKQVPPGGFPPFGEAGIGQQDEGGAQGPGQAAAGQMFPSGPQQGAFDATNFFSTGSFLFSIPAEKTVQLELKSICLDHGKPTPSPRMTYELRPIEEHTSDAALQALIETADFSKRDRRALQAAAWHLSSGMDWKQLKAKTIDRGAGIHIPYLTRAQLEEAENLVKQAQRGTTVPVEARVTAR